MVTNASHPAMITSNFLLEVIVYGLVAALAIPVVDFVRFVLREGRRAGRVAAAAPTVNDWRPARSGSTGMPARNAARGATPSYHASDRLGTSDSDRPGMAGAAQSGTGSARRAGAVLAEGPATVVSAQTGTAHEGHEADRSSGRRGPASWDAWHPANDDAGSLYYTTSNGLTIKPNVPSHPGETHPHYEYWRYGDVNRYGTKH